MTFTKTMPFKPHTFFIVCLVLLALVTPGAGHGYAKQASATAGATSTAAPGQPDTTAVRQVTLDTAFWKNQAQAYDYGIKPKEGRSLWERFRAWLAKILERLFGGNADGGVASWVENLIYIVAALVLVYLLLMALGFDFAAVFSRKNKGQVTIEAANEEDIRGIDFENALKKAGQEEEWRVGIRLYYLYALKLLADKKVIIWRPGKTNQEVKKDLKNSTLAPAFNDLSFFYEYVWYGNFEANQGVFTNMGQAFSSFQNNLKQHKHG